MKNVKGFTLLELMITVSIVGILAAIAYPSYSDYLVKGHRANAKAFLLEIVQKEQQFLLDNRAYASKANLLAAGLAEPKELTNFYTWDVTLVPGPPPGFQVRASPISGSRQGKDGWLQVDNTGAKTSEKPDKW